MSTIPNSLFVYRLFAYLCMRAPEFLYNLPLFLTNLYVWIHAAYDRIRHCYINHSDFDSMIKSCDLSVVCVNVFYIHFHFRLWYPFKFNSNQYMANARSSVQLIRTSKRETLIYENMQLVESVKNKGLHSEITRRKSRKKVIVWKKRWACLETQHRSLFYIYSNQSVRWGKHRHTHTHLKNHYPLLHRTRNWSESITPSLIREVVGNVHNAWWFIYLVATRLFN